MTIKEFQDLFTGDWNITMISDKSKICIGADQDKRKIYLEAVK